jgi:dTDP-4-dehydrorhamnose 3,5-epimerase
MGISMKFSETYLKGAYTAELEPSVDERGTFYRVFCKMEYIRIGHEKEIVQINHSLTRQRGTIRGMHYQVPPASETKIIRCIRGTAYDVIVDIRAGSPTFLRWHGVEISKNNMQVVYIPEGFAHGFQALEDNTELLYQHTAFYNPTYEQGLRFNDPQLSIKWPLDVSSISERDSHHPFIDSNFQGVQV